MTNTQQEAAEEVELPPPAVFAASPALAHDDTHDHDLQLSTPNPPLEPEQALQNEKEDEEPEEKLEALHRTSSDLSTPPITTEAHNLDPENSQPLPSTLSHTHNDDPRPETAPDTEAADLPPLHRGTTRLAQKSPRMLEHIGITFGLPMILLFDIIVPCIIYYTWYNSQVSHHRTACATSPTSSTCLTPPRQFDKDILGGAIASFGIGELYILLARIWRLVYRRSDCAPLLSRNVYELDATSWVYGVAMLIALVPFVVGSSLVIPKLYLYGPAFLMTFLGVLMLVTTLHPFKIPIGINSHARGTGLRPFIYYAAEDFIAVDGLQDREFRVRYNERYETNRAFRRMFVYLTWWWELGVCMYLGAVSAVIWTLEFHYAFGLSLGVLFAYIFVWAAVSYVWVQMEVKRENEALERALGTV